MRIVETHTGKIYVDKDKQLVCTSLVSRLLIKGETPTKRSIRKITEFTEMSADEAFYLPDIAA